jgi:tetratricopeptide (TPR) repeat protein
MPAFASASPAPAPAIESSAAIFADALDIPPLALDLGGEDIGGLALADHPAEPLPLDPLPSSSGDSSAPPADDHPAVVEHAPARVDVASESADEVSVSEDLFVAGEAAVEDGADDDAAVEFETGPDEDAEFVLDAGEEIEVEVASADRGALLAASVTSRRKDDDDHERLFAVDARAEAIARAAMLVEEAEHAASPGLAAEFLTLAADIHEGVVGDRARARELVLRARGLAPQLLAPLRALRRLAIAGGDSAAALALCDEELALPLSDVERHETRLLAAELASLTGQDAPRRWDEAAVVGGLPGALARIFSAGIAHDRQAMGDALGGLAAETGGVLAASVDVARARLIEASADQSALAVIRDAVRRDPTDTGAWLAIARIGLGRANAGLFREALTGLARAAEGGVGARAADATRVALDAILGDPVAPVPVDGDGAEAWLVAHALRDGLGDPSAQVERSLAGPDGPGRDEWLQWKTDAPRGHAARYAALQRAVAQRADAAVASAGAAFLGGDSAGLVEAGLRAQGAAVDPVEADLTGLGSGAAGSVLRAALVATTSGIDAAEAVGVSSGEGPWSAIMRHHAQAHAGQRDEARAAFAALTAAGASAGAVAFARRAVWLLGGDPADVTAALRAEAAAAVDPRRAAGQRLLASCLAASGGLPDGGDDAVRAAEALPGDLAAAEIAALHAQRGEPVAHAGADLFDAAASGDGPAPRMAAVRAALRRAASDHDAAAESVWRSWQRQPLDFALGTLVLRSPARGSDRAAAVARALADAAWAAGRDRADAVVGATAFLAAALEPAKRFTEAAQAIARARSLALADVALEAAEERLWLRGGMYAEAAERAFDRLNASADIDQRLAAYERLVEIDRSYRGQAASAVLSLQEILAVAPGHQPSLHALLRFFSEQGRHEEVAELCRRFVEHAADARDALAFAHLGARLAVALADGDPFAGLSFHQAVRGRALHDTRLLNALDAAARRAGDHPQFAEVQLGLAESAADGTARAVHLTRAGDAFDAIGDRGRALDCYLRAVAAAPHDLAALLAVAGLTGVMDDPRGAAEAWESVGAAAVTAEVAVRAWMTAAALWRDRLNERTRCLAALRQALARDPTHRAAFVAALAIVRDAGDAAGELELLERYAPSESAAPDDAVSMHARAAEIAESQGDLPRAIAQWRAALGLAPESASTLRALARVARAAAEWTVAADAMIRLAKTSTDEAERVELLYGLGEIFESHIPDARRAEAAWRRVLVLAPRDERTLVKLSALYRRTGDAAREADVTQSLAAALAPSPERTERLLRLAAIAELPLGDLKRAVTALEVARRDNPSDLRVLRAFRSFHERNHHPAAALALVDRAIVEVRGATDRDPRDTAAIARLSELLELRGQGDASRIAAAVAVALGSDDDRARSIAGDGAVQGIGAAALTPDAIALLAPPAVELPLRELLERAAPVLEPLAPFDPLSLGAVALGADDHPLRADLAAWARMLELGEVEIWVAPDVPAICMPVSRATPAVVVSAQREATPAGRFAAARAMLLTALSLAIPTRLAVSELTLVIGALLRQFDPMYRPEGVDAGRLVELSAQVTRALSRELHAELRPIAQRILADGVKDAEAIRAGAHELGDRVALLATGDVAGGIALLSAGARRASESVATIDRLLRVALSERFMEARRIAGADRGAER